MATFPTYVKLGWRDHAEKPTPVVMRSEMERGIARQRRTAADSVVTVPVTAYFDTAADALAFESWFFGDALAGADWFDFTLPRTGTVTLARVVGGDIGPLKPATKNWAFSERTFQLEYIRPGFVQLAPGLHSVDSSRILSVQRSTTATYIDAAGVLQTAPANVARYQGGQLLVEGGATNLLTYSQDFGNSTWFKSSASVSVSATSSPIAATCYKLTENTATASHSVAHALVTPAAGSQFVSFVIAKAAERSRIILRGVANNNFYANFDLAAGGVGVTGPGTSAGVVALSGGWFLCWVAKAFASAGSSGARSSVALAPADGLSDGYAGDGVSGVLLACAQFADGLDWSSYIPTTTAPATRAADLITVAA